MTGKVDIQTYSYLHLIVIFSYVLCVLHFMDIFIFIFAAGTWVNVASQATPKSWVESQYRRADQRKNPEQRNFSQVL